MRRQIWGTVPIHHGRVRARRPWAPVRQAVGALTVVLALASCAGGGEKTVALENTGASGSGIVSPTGPGGSPGNSPGTDPSVAPTATGGSNGQSTPGSGPGATGGDGTGLSSTGGPSAEGTLSRHDIPSTGVNSQFIYPEYSPGYPGGNRATVRPGGLQTGVSLIDNTLNALASLLKGVLGSIG